MRLWSRERHRSVRLSWCLTGAKVGQAEMANLQGFFQVVFVPPFKHSCEIWKTRSTDNLCLPFAVYLCPKHSNPSWCIRSSMPANLLCSHLSYSSPSYSPCSWTGYYVIMSIIINTSHHHQHHCQEKIECDYFRGRPLSPSLSKTIFAHSSKTVQCGVSMSKIMKTKPWIGCCDLIAIQQCREQISKVNSSMSTFS